MSKHSPLPYLPGAVVVLFGAAMAIGASSYPLGSLFRPGPGFFPLVISVALALMGLGVMAEAWTALRSAPPSDDAPPQPVAWRALACTIVSVLVFAFGVERIGYVPAALLLIGISGLAERRSDWPSLILVALFMTIFGTLVFIWGLGLPIAAFGAS